MKKNFVWYALVVLSGVVLICSCSKNSNTPMPMSATGGMPSASLNMSSVAVSIMNMGFMPDTIKIKAGTVVTWTNMDDMSNTVTEVDNMFNSGSLMIDQSFSFTFLMAGAFQYGSLSNPMMKDAVVIVSK